MQRGKRLINSGLLVACALLASPAAFAQAARSSSSGGNAQVLQQLQQLAGERTQLLGDNAKLKAELAAMRKERDELKKKQDADDRRLQSGAVAVARVSAQKESLQQDLDREKSRLAELVAKFRETAGALREVETERGKLQTSLTTRAAELQQCVDRNRSLYTLNGEILTRLEDRRGFTPASVLEPFTKLKRVELENLIDGYQTRADEQRPPTAMQNPPGR